MSSVPAVSEVPAVRRSRLVRPRLTRAWSLRTSFGLVVATQVLLFAGSNIPTPLFPLYEQRYGFGPGTVTALFAVYVVPLIPTLLLVGRIADRIGRRPLLASGIALTVLSSIAFATAQSLAWLFAGELVYGVGSGLVMSVVAVAIRELHPGQDVTRASLAASVAAVAGLTLGPLVSGFLAWAAPWPTVSPYLLDILLATLLAVALLGIPETRPELRPGSTPARTPLVHVPREIRFAFVPVAVAGAVSFMVVAWVLGLSPSYLNERLHVHLTQPVVTGSFAALVLLVSGAAQIFLRRHHGPRVLRAALTAAAAGMGVIAASGFVGSLAVAIAGAVLVGVGTGVAQMNALASIQHLAPVHARSGVTSAYFTLCYLAMSVPLIVAGEAAETLGLRAVTTWYFVGLAVFVASAVVLSRRLEGVEPVLVRGTAERAAAA
jgi:MFS family permease